MNPQPAGWYLRNQNDNIVHYWDGAAFTGHTNPRTDFDFPVFQEPAAPVAQTAPAPEQPVYNPASAPQPAYGSVPPQPQPQYGGFPAQPQYGQAPAKTGVNKPLLFGLIGGGVLLFIIGIIAVIFLILPNGGNDPSDVPPISAPTSEPSDPSDEPSDEPSEEPSEDPTDEPSDNADRDEAGFVQTINAYPGENPYAGVPDQSLIDLGDGVCLIFESGGTVEQVAKALTDAGLPAEYAGYFTATSVRYLCSDYQPLIDDFIEQNT